MGLLILSYLILRTVVVPITVDELLTLQYFVEHDWSAVLTSWNEDITRASNNHVLNSIFFKLSVAIFGEHDWAIRIHIIVAFIVSYYFIWRMLRMFVPSATRLSFYLAVIFLNPYLLDFFAIARGYALSIAGWSAATYFFIAYCQKAEIRCLRNTMIWLFVSVYANFSAVYFALLFGAGIVYQFYKNRDSVDIRRHVLLFSLSAMMMALIIAIPFYRTVTSHTTHGGTNSFFNDSIVSYIAGSTHYNRFIGRSGTLVLGWKHKEVYAAILVFVWVAVTSMSIKLNREENIRIAQNNLIYQCIGIALICTLFFKLFKIPYPFNRTTLLFSFPFIVSFVVALETIIKKYDSVKYAFVPIGAALLWHFIVCCNLDNTYEWKQEGDAKRVLTYLRTKYEEDEGQKTLSIGVENWRYPSMAFYGRSAYKGIVQIEWTDLHKHEAFDYLYVPKQIQGGPWSDYGFEKNFKHGVLLKRFVKGSQ